VAEDESGNAEGGGMKTILIGAALLAAPLPAWAQAAPAAATAPDPALAAAADKAVASLVPRGIYLRMMRDQFPKMMDAMMSQMSGMKASDLGLPPGKNGDVTLAAAAEKEDPAFQERMSVMTRVMGEELGPVFEKMEPAIRAGLSRSFQRRFSLAQLTDMNAFFGTPSGAAFANDYLLTFMDPEMMQSVMAAMPEMMKAMPAVFSKVEQETARLPKPKKQAEGGK
jgi:hypothetical protein